MEEEGERGTKCIAPWGFNPLVCTVLHAVRGGRRQPREVHHRIPQHGGRQPCQLHGGSPGAVRSTVRAAQARWRLPGLPRIARLVPSLPRGQQKAAARVTIPLCQHVLPQGRFQTPSIQQHLRRSRQCCGSGLNGVARVDFQPCCPLQLDSRCLVFAPLISHLGTRGFVAGHDGPTTHCHKSGSIVSLFGC